MSAESRWRLAFRVVVVQAGLTVAVAALWWFWGGSALAALAGGGVVTLMSLYGAVRAFSVDAAADPEGFLRRLYRAEFMKLLMTVLFFLLAARYASEHMAEIVTAFAVALTGFWLGLWPVASGRVSGSARINNQ
ncbi:ATP synthase protein I [Natronospira proteinivora]|uniref:ATP synthase protein I n=1 Tax=Natronospira proteinivora TaxID=1807133 RepID=A0ABT1GA86_9GAMM|nr:ATP synthase subunit I [Natronospira proteinivora]MCP1728233.1 ATP synthase protein I [Natronospira proteinivora]